MSILEISLITIIILLIMVYFLIKSRNTQPVVKVYKPSNIVSLVVEDKLFYQKIPSKTWIIDHSFDSTNVLINVFDADNNWMVVESIIYVTNHQVKITFTEPKSGYGKIKLL